MKNCILIALVFSLFGCSTTARQSADGKTLTIKGFGKAKFDNGAEISGEPLLKFPTLKVQN